MHGEGVLVLFKGMKLYQDMKECQGYGKSHRAHERPEEYIHGYHAMLP